MSQPAKNNDKTEHRYASERLSAYLDRQLPPQERLRVEHHLARCPHCQWEFSTLRATVQWTRDLPTVPVPRAFTVPVPARPVRVAQRAWALPLLQGATALVALLFLVAVIGELFLPQVFPALGAHRPAAEAPVPASVEVTKVVELQMAAPAEPLPSALQPEPTRSAVAEAVVQATVEEEIVVQHTVEVAAASVPPGEAAPPPTAPLPAGEALPTEGEADSAALKAPPPAAAATATPEVGIMRSAGAGSGPETPPPGVMQPEAAAEAPTTVAVESASPTALPSPTPFPTTVPAPAALAEAQADEPATAAQVEQPPQAVRAVRTPPPAWLSLAVMGLGIAFVLLGSATVLLMVRRLRAR